MENQFIKEEGSTVSFTLQNGPIKEVGVNGCQIDDVITWAKEKVEEFNRAFSCNENQNAITSLSEALRWLARRKANRESRGVEGTNKA